MSSDLYEALEKRECNYVLRLKENAKLQELDEMENQALERLLIRDRSVKRYILLFLHFCLLL